MSDFNKEAFERTKIVGSIAHYRLDEVSKIIQPGKRTDEIDKYVMNILMIMAHILHHFYRGF